MGGPGRKPALASTGGKPDARRRRTGRRLLLGGVVASLSATALLAIGILLLGELGETEGRILGTTALLAAYGLLGLPAGFLLDQGRLRPLAATVLALAAAGLAAALAAVWSAHPPDALGKALATVTALAAASTQTAALAARRRGRDSASVRRLFAGSTALALALAAMVASAAWAEVGASAFYRVLGALAVLDALAVALQPILALARPGAPVHELRLRTASGETVETSVEAPDFATAAARAIRRLEREGHPVVGVERARPGRR